jgi:hypothetical protein
LPSSWCWCSADSPPAIQLGVAGVIVVSWIGFVVHWRRRSRTSFG